MKIGTISNKLIEVIEELGAKVLEAQVAESNKKGMAVLSINGVVSTWYYCVNRGYWTRAGY